MRIILGFLQQTRIFARMDSQLNSPGGGGHSTFFSGKDVRPRFPKCGASELIFAYQRGVLGTEFFKFGGLRAKIWAKIDAVEAKISKFFSKGGLVN